MPSSPLEPPGRQHPPRQVLFLRHGQPSATAERTAAEFTELMMVERPDYEWVGAEDFVAEMISLAALRMGAVL